METFNRLIFGVVILIVLLTSLYTGFALLAIIMWGGASPLLLLVPLLGTISFYGLIKMKRWALYTTTLTMAVLLGFLLTKASKTTLVYSITSVLFLVLCYLWCSYKKFN